MGFNSGFKGLNVALLGRQLRFSFCVFRKSLYTSSRKWLEDYCFVLFFYQGSGIKCCTTGKAAEWQLKGYRYRLMLPLRFWRWQIRASSYNSSKLTFWHRSFTFNSNKSPTWCYNFSVYYPDVCLQLHMFRAFSRPSSRAQWQFLMRYDQATMLTMADISEVEWAFWD